MTWCWWLLKILGILLQVGGIVVIFRSALKIAKEGSLKTSQVVIPPRLRKWGAGTKHWIHACLKSRDTTVIRPKSVEYTGGVGTPHVSLGPPALEGVSCKEDVQTLRKYLHTFWEQVDERFGKLNQEIILLRQAHTDLQNAHEHDMHRLGLQRAEAAQRSVRLYLWWAVPLTGVGLVLCLLADTCGQ